MEVRSSPALANTGDPNGPRGLSANEVAGALIPMMARSTMLQSKAGYIDARPLPPDRQNSLATHGRTIHLGQSRRCRPPQDGRDVRSASDSDRSVCMAANDAMGPQAEVY